MEDLYKVFSSSKFAWDKEAFTLTAKKEDVPGFLRWLDKESMVMGLAIKSANTGSIRKFKIHDVVKDENNQIVYWEFKVAEDVSGPLEHLRVIVLN